MKKARPKKPHVSFARESATAYVADSPAGINQQISAGEFKARCLAIMDEVQSRGGEYVITKRGVPVAKLVPVRVERRRLLGSMKGTVKVLGDIVSPLDEPWEALGAADDEHGD